jgi:hypothetical protein
MTKIGIWKCEICKREFREQTNEYGWNAPVSIKIEARLMYETQEYFNFADTCADCRQKLRDAINELILGK